MPEQFPLVSGWLCMHPYSAQQHHSLVVPGHFCGLFIWSQMIMRPILMVARRVSPINLGATHRYHCTTSPSAPALLLFLGVGSKDKYKKMKKYIFVYRQTQRHLHRLQCTWASSVPAFQLLFTALWPPKCFTR